MDNKNWWKRIFSKSSTLSKSVAKTPTPDPQENDESSATPGSLSASLPPRDRIGLSLVWPKYAHDPKENGVDIVFVHGLNGSSRGSWTLNDVSWPSDLLPSVVENATILTFGYNANLLFDTAEGTISTFAQNLLAELMVFRGVSRATRPLLFVGHSMGGLVIKRALTIARDVDKFPGLLVSVRAVVFMGTPHQGSASAGYAHFGARVFAVLRATRTSSATGQLTLFSESVRTINEDFVGLAKNLVMLSFYEQKAVPGVGMIVESWSATMGHASERYCIGINADHLHICRYEGAQDDNWMMVSRQLKSLVDEICNTVVVKSNAMLIANSEDQGQLVSQASLSAESTHFNIGEQLFNDQGRRVSQTSIPRGSSLKFLPAFSKSSFFGRSSLLKGIRKALYETSDSDMRVCGLYGMSGVGKSHLALKYAYDHSEDYDNIFWVNSDTEEKLMRDIDKIVKSLDPSLPALSPTKSRQKFLEWLSELSDHRNWLLIFDNVDDLKLLQRLFWPTSKTGSVLLTSKSPEVGQSRFANQGFEVEPFSSDQGTDFLVESLPSDADKIGAARAITQILGGLPLALCQVIGYVESNSCSLQDFLDIPDIRKLSFELLNEHQGVAVNFNYSLGFAAAFDQSLASLKKYPEAIELLEVLVLLDPDCVMEKVIQSGANRLTSGSLPCLQDLRKYNTAIGILRNQSLVKKDKSIGQLSIHQMVCWAVIRHWSPASWQTAFDRVKDLLLVLFPKQIKGQSTTVGQDLERCRATAMHVYALGSRYREAKSHLSVSISFAELLANFGYYLYERGQLQTASEVLASALEICENLLGQKPHLITALVLNNIAIIHSSLNQIPQALKINLRVLAYREELLEGYDQELGNVINNIATNYYDLGRLEEAETHFLRAIEIMEQGTDVKPPLLAILLSNAGRNYIRLVRYDIAEDMLQRALKLQRTHNGNVHYYTSATIYRLANLRLRQGRIDDAETYITECLAIRRELLGDDDIRVGVAMHKMASLRFRQGLIADALDLLTQAISTFKGNETVCERGLIVRSMLLKALILSKQANDDSNPKMQEDAKALRNEGLELRYTEMSQPRDAPAELESDFDALVQADYR